MMPFLFLSEIYLVILWIEMKEWVQIFIFTFDGGGGSQQLIFIHSLSLLLTLLLLHKLNHSHYLHHHCQSELSIYKYSCFLSLESVFPRRHYFERSYYYQQRKERRNTVAQLIDILFKQVDESSMEWTALEQFQMNEFWTEAPPSFSNKFFFYKQIPTFWNRIKQFLNQK